MKKNHKRILDAISELDNGVVDRVSEKRFSLWVKLQERIKRRRARLIGASVGAAALAACVLILALLLPLLSFPGGGGGAGTGDGTDSGNGVPILPDPRQIPIYQGMTVSDKAPAVSTQAWIEDGSFLLSAKGDIHGHRPVIDKDKPFGQAKKDVEETIKDSLNITASSDERYYAAKNSDIYITVHLSNPDKFEILSFTLNGEKYSNYMFEAGSDLENLILKVNTGNRDGIVQYTIDAIKYVDGTEIKDVRMEGERTVDVVITPENQPTAALTLMPAFHSITASVKVTDTLGLVEDGEKIGVYAYLYDGDTLVGEKKLKVGENTVTFEGLASNTLYEIAVVGVYDALDGKGVAIHLLSKDAVYTEAYVLFDEVKLQGTTLSFRLLWNEKTEVRVLSSLALYWEGGKIKDLPLDATEITELTSEESYSIIGTYTADGETVTIQLDFFTEKLHSISFVTNGGVALGTKMLSAKEALPVPEREGFTFGGWYRDANLNELVESVPAGGGTLYAYWKEESKPGAFVFEDGVISALTDSNTTEVHVPAYIGGNAVTKFELWTSDTTGSKLKKLTVSGAATSVRICNKATLEEVDLPAVGTGEIMISNCTALKALAIPHGVEWIPGHAFRHCTALERVTLPGSLTTIDNTAFALCTSLKSITVPGSVTAFDVGALYGCTSLERIVLEEGVQSLDGSFEGCTSLTELVLPDSLTQVDCDFSGAPNIRETVDGVTYYDSYAALCETNVTSVTLREGTTLLSASLFENCDFLRSVTLPEGLRIIPTGAFSGLTSLESVILPSTLTKIRTGAFSDCSSLVSITLPASLETIEAAAFSGCSALASITVAEGNSAYHFAGNCLIETESKTLIWGCGSSVIPTDGSVTSIGVAAFQDCTSLTSITIPDGVTTIGSAAFFGCSALTSLVLPTSLETIGLAAFNRCDKFRVVYYCGNDNDYSHHFTEAEYYYYSAEPPTSSGNYWRYVDDVPTAWLPVWEGFEVLEIPKTVYVTLGTRLFIRKTPEVTDDNMLGSVYTEEQATVATALKVVATNRADWYMVELENSLEGQFYAFVSSNPLYVTEDPTGSVRLTLENLNAAYPEYEILDTPETVVATSTVNGYRLPEIADTVSYSMEAGESAKLVAREGGSYPTWYVIDVEGCLYFVGAFAFDS